MELVQVKKEKRKKKKKKKKKMTEAVVQNNVHYRPMVKQKK